MQQNHHHGRSSIFVFITHDKRGKKLNVSVYFSKHTSHQIRRYLLPIFNSTSTPISSSLSVNAAEFVNSSGDSACSITFLLSFTRSIIPTKSIILHHKRLQNR